MKLKEPTKKTVKKVTNCNIGKKTMKARRVYGKRMNLLLTGTSKAALQKVASKIHALSSDETIGGCLTRTVQITSESGEPKQIFYGNI